MGPFYHSMMKDGNIPLTPALSQGERENCLSRVGGSLSMTGAAYV